MKATIHLTPQTKSDLDAILPDKVDGNKISYDDSFKAIIYFLTTTLNYSREDILKLITDYRDFMRQLESDILIVD
jgi:hypothetical protein